MVLVLIGNCWGGDAGRRDAGRGRLTIWDRLGTRYEPVHPPPGGRRHAGRLSKYKGQDLMAGGDLRQPDVAVECCLLQFGDFVGREYVIQILGDGVWVG